MPEAAVNAILQASKSTPKEDPVGKTKEYLKQLGSAAQTLNDLSDRLTNEVCTIEAAVNRLNIGIRARVELFTIEQSDDRSYTHWVQIAFGKLNGRWGFLIEECTEDLNNPDQGTRESWHFKDSPREYRLKAVEKIPDLLAALVTKSAEVAAEMSTKVTFANNLVVALNNANADSVQKK